MTGVVFIAVLIFLLLAAVPVGFGLGISSVFLMWLEWGYIRWGSIPQMMVAGVNTFTILAVPLFLLAGNLMNVGGITDRLFRFAKVLVGFLPGSLGHVVVIANVIFAGMSGTAVADATGLGPIVIRTMRKNGFSNEFACSVTAAASTIGPIIPPSLPLVIYGMMASTSVGALFIGGILPGLLMAFILMCVVGIYAVKNNYPRDPFPTISEFWEGLKGGFLPMMTPVIIIGGIYTGFFTPTEAAVVVVVYAFCLSTFVYREMNWRKLHLILKQTARDSAAIGFILAAATLYGNVIVRAQIPQEILASLTGAITSPLMMLFVLNLFLLVVGCFMETISAITILMPIIVPLLDVMHINPIHFGIVMVLNLMIGVLTPPFGMVLFVISRIGEISIPRLTMALLPWMGALLVALALITVFPEITLFLPRMFGVGGL